MNIPKNIEAYYQETGRAGRDGLPSNALMLYGTSDVAMQRSFIEDSTAPDQQKRIENQKLNALLGLCEATCCRRQVVLEYFGDTGQPCANCDTCDTPAESFDGTIAAQKAISCVYRTEQRFGVSYLIDVLRGEESERILNFGHHRLSTFGIGKEYSKQAWQSIFRQLVAQNLLRVDIAQHGGLKMTPQAMQFLKEKQTIRLRTHTERDRSRGKRHSRSYSTVSGNIDDTLFEALKARRRELALAQNVPPYVIFHDKTLREFAAQKPASLEAMSEITGVGASKLERYGKEFLAVMKPQEAQPI